MIWRPGIHDGKEHKAKGGTMMRLLHRGIAGKTIFFLASLLFLTAQAASAGYVNPQLLATPADVEKNAGKWIVLDTRDLSTTTDRAGKNIPGYNDGHIPGAITLGGNAAKVLRTADNSVVLKDGNGGIDVKKYEKILGEAGISNDRTIVVYGDAGGITNTTVTFWILELLGHKDVRFLNGGIEAWQTAGKKLDTAATKLAAAKYVVDLKPTRIATTDEVLRVAKGELKNVQIVDSRTGGEHAGTDVRAKRGGRIPNSLINVSHADTFDRAAGAMKPMPELQQIFGSLDKDQRVVPYCQTGTRSTLTYLIFRLMGFKDPANYDDSWIVWGNSDNLPI
jgi:thiosulfate/3-mercaptopyruvate sulfurtransferase